MTKEAVELQAQNERTLLVALDFKKKHSDWSVNEVRLEMEELILACGGDLVESIIVKVAKPTAGYLISETKADEIAGLVSIKDVDTVVFSYDLKGSQQRNLEEKLKIKTIDRTQLILDIFAKHATSQEGKMQVELAQLEYLLPRLVGRGIELSRLGGGIGTLGPGETKLEVDRRRIGQRIAKLKSSLKDVSTQRALNRKKRKEKGLPAVSLVGYTNAGKSTLLNVLSGSRQKARDGLFTTLDSLARQMSLPNHQKVVLSDTVGFMNELPHHLIEAFKATLEEVQDADLLLHVLDISHPNFRHLHDSVQAVLKELDALNKPTITVLNKVDKLESAANVDDYEGLFENGVSISALKRQNLDALLEKVAQQLSGLFVEIDCNIPIDRMDLVSLAHEEGAVFSVKYYNDRINIRASVPAQIAGKFK